MIVLYNTNYTHNANSYLTASLLEGARKAFQNDEIVLADNETLMQLLANGTTSTLICVDGQRLRSDILQRVRPTVRQMVLWLFEDPFMLTQNLQNAAIFDLIFTNDPICVAAYGSKAKYLPLAASLSQDFRQVLSENDLEYDIFFAGTMWPNRTILIERLIRRFPNARIKLVCPTNEYLPPLSREIAERCIDRAVSHSTFADFANRSKVVLTIYRDYTSGEGSGAATAPGPRYFEVALAGVPQVISIGANGSADYFDIIAGNVVAVKDEEIFSAIDEMLVNPSLRQSKALMSQQIALDSHLYTHRFIEIRDSLSSQQHRVPLASRKQTRVVFCTHSIRTAAHIGGVEIYQDLIGSMLGEDFELFYWIRDNKSCLFLDRGLNVVEVFSAPEIGWLDVLSDPHEEALFSGLLTSYGIDVVHFHHLGHHCASLPIITKALGIGVVFSVHDYFLICSRYNLLDYQHRFCNIASRSIAACDTCLKISEGLVSGAQQTRRAFMSDVVDSVDKFLFGTRYSLEFMTKIYPRLNVEHCEVLGVLNQPARGVSSNIGESPYHKPLRIAVYGNFLRSKGADCLIRVIETLRSSDYMFYVFGQAEEAYRKVLEDLSSESVKFLNGYNIGDIGTLPSCDVALFLSIWPETFSISLSEAWQTNTIPIATDIGAFADRIIDGVNGFLVPVNDDSSIIGILQRLKDNPEIVARMRSAIGPTLWPECREHIERLRTIYRSYRPKTPLAEHPVKIDAGQIGLIPHFSWRISAPPRHILEADPASNVALSLDLSGLELVDLPTKFCIESIGGEAWIANKKNREQNLPIEILGWMFSEGEVLSGQVKLGFVGDHQAIFVDAVRRSRPDVCLAYRSAPEYSGFLAAASFLGRWSDGFYYIVLLQIVSSRVRVALTSIGVQLHGGAIISAKFLPSNSIHRKYVIDRLLGRTSKMPIMEDPFASTDSSNNAAFLLEEVTRQPSGQSNFLCRGWFLCKDMDSDSTLYIGWQAEADISYIAVERKERADVRDALGTDVLYTGFSEEIEIPRSQGLITLHIGWSDGVRSSKVAYRVVLASSGKCEILEQVSVR